MSTIPQSLPYVVLVIGRYEAGKGVHSLHNGLVPQSGKANGTFALQERKNYPRKQSHNKRYRFATLVLNF